MLDALHEPSGARRAIKLMLPVGRAEEVARRMEREFAALARLDHPNILRVYDAGTWQGRPWFACERLEGEELGAVVEGWRNWNPSERFAEASRILVALAEALAFIHDQGLVHRDLTPSNVMVLPDGGVRLMDFGVVKEHGVEATQVGEVVGTVAWIAPEQIISAVVDGRADLYALGAVLYLMLTGRRPFNARNLAGFLDKHLNRAPRPPRELAPTLPERLDSICLRLLEKRPEDRFASARHLLLALDDGPLPGLDINLGPSHLPIAGRAAALVKLRDSILLLGSAPDAVGAPGSRGGLVVVEAADGMGKSRVVTQAVDLARGAGLAVTRVRGTGDPRPWSGLRALLDGVASRAGFEVPAGLARLLDTTRAAEPWAVAGATRDLIEANGPRLLVIDDAQRVDRSSLELLAFLLRNLAGRDGFPLLVLLTRDTGEPAPSIEAMLDPKGSLLPLDLPVHRIRLEPLGLSAVEELLLYFVVDGPAPRALALRLHASSEGNPLFLAQMLQALIERGILLPGSAQVRGHLILEESQVTRAVLPVPGTIRQALLARLATLDRLPREVLELMAIAREPLDSLVIAQACGPLSAESLADAQQQLAKAGLVLWGEGQGGRSTLARHRLADVMVEELDEARRRELHGRLARALEVCHRHDLDTAVVAIADHYEAAGYPAIAWPFLVMAARRLSAVGEVGEALVRLDRGLGFEQRARGFVPLAEADRRLSEALQMRASALVHLGRWEEAHAEARRSYELASSWEDDLRASRAATELGALARRRHDLDEARTWLDTGLRLARSSGDVEACIPPLYELGGLRWAQGDLDGARQHWVEVLALAEGLGDERMQALGANGLGVVALCRGDAAEARRNLERAVELCQQYGLAERLVIARINLIELHHLTGNLRKAAELADLTVAQAREAEHSFGLALGLRYRALVLVDLGRLAEARENAAEAVRMQRQLGNPEDELSARVILVREALYARDTLRAEVELEACAPLLKEHDTEGMGPVLHAWRARLLHARGQPERARRELDAARQAPGRQWPHQRIRFLLNLSRAAEELGDREEAGALAEEALRLAEGCGYRLYVLKARRIAARATLDEAAAARHLRVAEALARSLSANLAREEGEPTLSEQPSLG